MKMESRLGAAVGGLLLSTTIAAMTAAPAVALGDPVGSDPDSSPPAAAPTEDESAPTVDQSPPAGVPVWDEDAPSSRDYGAHGDSAAHLGHAHTIHWALENDPMPR